MKLSRVLESLQSLADERLAEAWDRVGLAVGDPAWPVRRAMLCIDLTPGVMAEAMAAKASLIVAYHPPIFEPLQALTTADWKQRIIMEAVRRRIALYSPHTALDSAVGGVNDWLCDAVLPGWFPTGASNGGSVRPIRSVAGIAQPFKLVTYVPAEQLERVRQAIWQAGGGHIGAYDQCSFSVEGQGTFRGGEGTNPTIGKPGRLETVTERRLETVVPAAKLAAAVRAMVAAHPYEEPAFDVFRLEPPVGVDGRVGQGRIIALDKPLALTTLTARLKKHLGVKSLEVAAGGKTELLSRLGLCAGAGGSLLADAGDVQAFITGEMRHHEVLAAVQRGQTVILAGHTQTERPYLPVYAARLRQLVRDVTWQVSKADVPPGVVR
ncbi:MAG: Nif3-like dinuclear metal center hexameric protein [Phycisphaeraceae bacterium]